MNHHKIEDSILHVCFHIYIILHLRIFFILCIKKKKLKQNKFTEKWNTPKSHPRAVFGLVPSRKQSSVGEKWAFSSLKQQDRKPPLCLLFTVSVINSLPLCPEF